MKRARTPVARHDTCQVCGRSRSARPGPARSGAGWGAAWGAAWDGGPHVVGMRAREGLPVAVAPPPRPGPAPGAGRPRAPGIRPRALRARSVSARPRLRPWLVPAAPLPSPRPARPLPRLLPVPRAGVASGAAHVYPYKDCQ
ncbi:hypothetical protein GCM10009863_06810 [Streptomyces axinellae]|uniref:Uncharacterized protein n=1 Tax=Streptomyces axinellae TaxID=552788 RepID=A0ABP6C0H1_9ACTN